MGGRMCVSRELREDLSADPAWAASWTGMDVGTGRAWGLSRGGHGPAQLLAGSLTFAESLGFSFFICEMGAMWNGALWGSTAATGSTQGKSVSASSLRDLQDRVPVLHSDSCLSFNLKSWLSVSTWAASRVALARPGAPDSAWPMWEDWKKRPRLLEVAGWCHSFQLQAWLDCGWWDFGGKWRGWGNRWHLWGSRGGEIRGVLGVNQQVVLLSWGGRAWEEKEEDLDGEGAPWLAVLGPWRDFIPSFFLVVLPFSSLPSLISEGWSLKQG